MITPDRAAGTETDRSRRSRASRPTHPVVIVGAGVAGSSLAYSLARRGLPSVLLETGRSGRQGASAVGVALLNPYRGRSGRPGPFDLAGLAAFWRTAEALRQDGLDPGARRSGVLRVASNTRQARAWQVRPEMVRQEVLAHPYRAPEGAFLVKEGGWVEPAKLLPALISAAARDGAELHEECGEVRLERHDREWRALTDRGVFLARNVVLCLGAGTIAGVDLPRLERIAGDIVTLASDVPLPYPIAGPVYLASVGDRVLVGGNHRPPETLDPHAPQLLRASAARLVPPLSDAPIKGSWTGVRAKRPDNLPLAEELEPGLWFLGAFGGRGFLTAPLLADRLADRVAARLGRG